MDKAKISAAGNLGGSQPNSVNGTIGAGASVPIGQNGSGLFGGGIGVTNGRPNANPQKGGGWNVTIGVGRRF